MSYWRRLVPDDFAVPTRLDADGFHLRMLTVNDLVKDYDAVMSSETRLRGSMNPDSDWPTGLTIEDDLIDLGWHQREFLQRRSFAYTVMSPDETVCLGCCYIYPSDKSGFEAKAFWWVRSSALADGLDERLGAAFRAWLQSRWPFKHVAFPGRDIAWSAWQKLA
jgi:hypothetical protein